MTTISQQQVLHNSTFSPWSSYCSLLDDESALTSKIFRIADDESGIASDGEIAVKRVDGTCGEEASTKPIIGGCGRMMQHVCMPQSNLVVAENIF